jgi:hypothetical protein
MIIRYKIGRMVFLKQLIYPAFILPHTGIYSVYAFNVFYLQLID